MADKKFNVVDIVFLIILLGLLPMISVSSCASQVRQTPQMDSNHYVAQVQQDYPCPKCGFLIPDKDVNPNIRTENKCPNCRKIFFGAPVEVAQKGKTINGYTPYGPYGPRNYGPTSVYQMDVNHQVLGVGGYYFKETPTGFWELSWYFLDRRTETDRVVSRWRTKRYHYP